MEQWKPIVINGARLIYEASNSGKIRHSKSLREKSHIVTRTGRRLVQLYMPENGRRLAAISVARLVAAAFLGEQPEGLRVIHIDLDRSNCRADNLLYAAKSNQRPGRQLLDAESHALIKRLWESGESQVAIAEMLGICNSTVSKIVRGKSNPHASGVRLEKSHRPSKEAVAKAPSTIFFR